VSLFRVCYQLVAGTDGGNDTQLFFTFTNRLGRVMRKTSKGKHTCPKRWRGRWLIIGIMRWFILETVCMKSGIDSIAGRYLFVK